MCDIYSYTSNPQSDNFEGSFVKEGTSFRVNKKPAPEVIELGISTKSKPVMGEISESKSRSSAKKHGRFQSILDEQLYRDRNPNESDDLKDWILLADGGYYDGGKMEKKSLAKDEIQQDILLDKRMDVFQVVGKGTHFMNSINMPTIIVKLLTSNLDKSTVYYLIVESETDENPWSLPAVMFSNPYAHKKTRHAELLPLCFAECSKSVRLTPLLRRKRHRRLFRSGFSYKAKSLLPGRTFHNTKEHLWNMYDIRNKAMRNVVREYIELDICQLSLHLKYEPMPLKQITKCRKDLRKDSCGQTVSSLPEILNHEEKDTTKETAHHKRSSFCTNNEIPEVGREEYSFSKCVIVRTTKRMEKKNRNAKRNTFSSTQCNVWDEFDDKCFCMPCII